MDVGSVNGSTAAQDLARILMMATQQQTGLAEKLIRVSAEDTVKANQLDTMGQIIDIYA